MDAINQTQDHLTPDAHDETAENAIRYVVVEVHNNAYGITSDHTVELVTASSTSITRIPHSPNSVAGVVNHRGNISPVIEMHELLELNAEASDGSQNQMLVVTEFEGQKAALLVDQVSFVADCLESDIESLPDSADTNGFVTGLVQRTGDGFILILDLPAVYTHACVEN